MRAHMCKLERLLRTWNVSLKKENFSIKPLERDQTENREKIMHLWRKYDMGMFIRVVNSIMWGGLSWVSVQSVNNLLLLAFPFLSLRDMEDEHRSEGQRSKLSLKLTHIQSYDTHFSKHSHILAELVFLTLFISSTLKSTKTHQGLLDPYYSVSPQPLTTSYYNKNAQIQDKIKISLFVSFSDLASPRMGNWVKMGCWE